MKKILISIMIVLLGIIAYATIVKGYTIGQIEVLSMDSIKQKNDELNAKIEEANKSKVVEYPEKMSELNKTAKELISKKKSYEELVSYSKSSDIEKANQIQKYEIEVLWTKIGMHATKNGVILKLDIVDSNTVSENNVKYFDLKFTATGSYISITDFIADLEKDAKLAFSIENFELVPTVTTDTSANGRNLQATFRVKDIALNLNTTNVTSNYDSNYEVTNNTKSVEEIQQ